MLENRVLLFNNKVYSIDQFFQKNGAQEEKNSMKCVLIDRKVGKGATGFVCLFSTDIDNPKGQNQKNEC